MGCPETMLRGLDIASVGCGALETGIAIGMGLVVSELVAPASVLFRGLVFVVVYAAILSLFAMLLNGCYMRRAWNRRCGRCCGSRANDPLEYEMQQLATDDMEEVGADLIF